MEKIKMTTPLVEMDGDEMTRILWKMIKDELILPFVDLKTEYYDLGLPNRDATADKVTMDAALANKKYGVSVKCATITPNAQRMDEYKLHEMWKSPNGTIRAVLDGTVFRAPIMIDSIKPVVKNWKKPITIARHAYGDVYKCTEFRIPGAGKAELLFTGADGTEQRATVFNFEGPGVLQGQYNKDDSIRSFARSCFNYALDVKQDLWFGAKDTISKKYDHTFKDIFQEVYDAEYKAKFEAAGITYFYSLIDDIVARVIRSEGGFVWACKNYDGDVMSDMVSTAFGSLAMMTSVLVLRGQLLDDVALQNVHLIGQGHSIAHHVQAVDQAAAALVLAGGDGLLGQTALFGGQGDQLLIVQRDTQLIGHGLGNLAAAGSILTCHCNNHRFLHN